MKRLLIALAAAFPLAAVPELDAQVAGSASSEGTTPTSSYSEGIHYACYVPATGTIHMIRTEGTAESCLSAQHVAVSWNIQGVAGPGWSRR